MPRSNAARKKAEDNIPSAPLDPAVSKAPLAGSKDLSPPDRLIHERVRLSIISALAVNDRLSFSELKSLLNITDGNLSVHARKLEDAKYISCKKKFENRMPKTEYAITAQGRKALEKYLSHMESLINKVRESGN